MRDRQANQLTFIPRETIKKSLEVDSYKIGQKQNSLNH